MRLSELKEAIDKIEADNPGVDPEVLMGSPLNLMPMQVTQAQEWSVNDSTYFLLHNNKAD